MVNKETTKEATEWLTPCEIWEEDSQILPLNYRQYTAQLVEDFAVYNDDVWLVTNPKAGTHWMQETLCCLLHGIDFEKLKSPNYKRSYNIEIQDVKLFKQIEEFQLSKEGLAYSESLERPRVMKTHLFWERLPKALRDPRSKSKIIYVARNPKDVCISRYFYNQMIPGKTYEKLTESLEDFAEEFINGRLAFMPFWTHVLGYWKQRNNPKVLFVKYEEMQTNFSKVLDRLQVFLNLNTLTEEQKQRMTDYLSFEKMKKNMAVNNFMHLYGKVYRKDYSQTGEEANFMRKGQIDGWKTEMSPKLVKKFDDWIEKNTAGTGYSVNPV